MAIESAGRDVIVATERIGRRAYPSRCGSMPARSLVTDVDLDEFVRRRRRDESSHGSAVLLPNHVRLIGGGAGGNGADDQGAQCDEQVEPETFLVHTLQVQARGETVPSDQGKDGQMLYAIGFALAWSIPRKWSPC